MNETIKHRIEQIKRGEVPNGYKKSKLGVLPGDWTSMTVGECLEKVEKPVAVEPDKLYTQIGIRSHGKGLFYKEPVTGESLGNKSVFWVEPDCFVLNIVFAWEQAIGKTTENEIGMIGSHRFPMFRPIDNRVDVDYLIAYLLTKRGTDILEAASPGGAGRNRTLGQDRFMNSKIILPPINEQKKIAEILATQDKVIALKERLLEEKKTQKKYLMQQLLTGKKRLAGFNTKWVEERIGKYLAESAIVTTPNINKRITVKLHLGGICHREIKAIEKEDATIQYLRKAGQFIYGKQNFHNGAFGIIPSELDGFQSSSDLPSFDISNQINKTWFFYYCSMSDFYRKLEITSTGTGSKRTRPDTFLDIKISFPSKEEQESIAELLSNADREILLIQNSIDEEKQKKKALMQLLLTGIVRV